jgi:capsid protein
METPKIQILDHFGKPMKFSAGNYDAVVDKKRRTAPKNVLESEDRALDTSDRKLAVATARRIRRNQVLLSWMIRHHLDFVTKFHFQPRTGNDELDQRLDDLIKWRGRAQNWDVAKRHNRDRFLRLMEASRIVDGDMGVLLLRSGGLQAIEGDRIAWPTRGNPLQEDPNLWTHGVKLDKQGAALSYMVCQRNKESLDFDKIVQARNMHHFGYFERFDQVRGISPLASAINTLQDLYELIEYQRIKSKMHSMLGVFISRDASASNSDGWNYTDADTEDGTTGATDRYDFELRPGLKIEGAPGDNVQMLESKNPSEEFQQFSQYLMQCAMLALDIPYVFFDSRESSYSANRQHLITYIKSVRRKQEDLLDFLNRVTAWDFARWTTPDATGNVLLQLPAGMEARDIQFEWCPDGIPWIDPLKEVNANIQAVSAGFVDRDTICREVYGRRFRDVIIQLGKEEAQAIAAGATMTLGQPGQISTRDEETDNPANAARQAAAQE